MDTAAEQEEATVVSRGDHCQFHQKARSGINTTYIATFVPVCGISTHIEKEQGLHCNAADSSPNLSHSGCRMKFLRISFHRRIEHKDREIELLTCILETYAFINITHVFLNEVKIQNSERILTTKSQASLYKCNLRSQHIYIS